MYCTTRPYSHARQRGISLFVVIIFVMLSMLLALWASRTSLFNEMIVGNDADYQRAFEAAQALVQDAELDIRGETADGAQCTSNVASPKICRIGSAIEKIPLEARDLSDLLSSLDNLPSDGPRCRNGICLKRSDRPTKNDKQDFWNNSDQTKGITLAQMTGVHADGASVGARYGEFTGANAGDDDNPASPILRDVSSSGRGGWYWIEVLPYDSAAGNSGLVVGGSTNLALNLVPNAVYRITAIAYGRKPNTQVVIQETFALQKRKD